MRRAGTWLQLFIATVLLMVPCLVSGRPQPFPDTRAYYALGQEIGTVLAVRPVGSAAATLRGRDMAPAETTGRIRLAYTVAAARSPFYSLYLYLLCRLGTAWLVVAVQAAATALILLLALRAFDLAGAYLPIVLALSIGTALPIFTFFTMPDFITALGLLSAIVLLTRWNVLARSARFAFAATVLTAALFHTGNALLLTALASGLLILGLVPKARCATLVPGAGTVLACALAGAAGLAAYPAAVWEIRHERIYAPPFVAARLIADGPGRRYLRERCGRDAVSRWCAFKDAPLSDNNLILWSRDPRLGAFQLAAYDARVRLIREQPGFVADVVRAYPGEVTRIAAANTLALLVNYRVDEVLESNDSMWTDPHFAVFASFIPGANDCAAGRTSCRSRIQAEWMNVWIASVLVFAVAGLAMMLALVPAMRATWNSPVLVLAFGLVLNAAICGVISGNAERYQARLMWLIPLVALCVAADLFRRKLNRRDPRRVAAKGRAATT